MFFQELLLEDQREWEKVEKDVRLVLGVAGILD